MYTRYNPHRRLSTHALDNDVTEEGVTEQKRWESDTDFIFFPFLTETGKRDAISRAIKGISCGKGIM